MTFGLQSFLNRESCIGPFCVGCDNVSCAAGDVLVPFSDGNQAELYSWVDGICSDTDNSNLELLPWGNPTVPNTPIAANLAGAVDYMSSVIAADDKNTCRPYVVVFLTDGEENCGNTNCSGSVTARDDLCDISVADRPGSCTVPTYMIGLPGANLACLDAIQDAPSTGRDQAIQATDRTARCATGSTTTATPRSTTTPSARRAPPASRPRAARPAIRMRNSRGRWASAASRTPTATSTACPPPATTATPASAAGRTGPAARPLARAWRAGRAKPAWTGSASRTAASTRPALRSTCVCWGGAACRTRA